MDEALLDARTQLLPEKLKVPVELPTVKVFRRYWRSVAAELQSVVALDPHPGGEELEGLRGQTVAAAGCSRFWKLVLLLKEITGICRYCELAAM